MEPFSLAQPLFQMPEGGRWWTIGNAVEGVQIFGGIGSGKTSGSGRTLALKFLAAGFGGLVLTAKPDEKALWEDYCRETGRLDDLRVMEPDGPHRFNFLAYEARQASGEVALTDNIVQVLKTVISASQEKTSGGHDDSFWENALDMLIVNVIDLCLLAYGTLSVRTLYEVASSAPRTTDDPDKTNESAFTRAYFTAKIRIDKQVDDWKLRLKEELPADELEWLELDHAAYRQRRMDALPESQLLGFVHMFFLENLKSLSPKTRSTIDFMFTGFLFRLLREPVYSLLCAGESTVTPEDSLAGKILLLNLPVKLYQKVGQDCQVLFKYIWQRAMEKRDIAANDRPVFLWADEAQNFLHEHDADYQATARSSRIATVYISQNLPNYYACMGGERSQHRVKSFLGTLNTKFFHANADIETNHYASQLIGQEYEDKFGDNVQVGPSYGQTLSRSRELVSLVRPEKFARLMTGGPQNGGEVECFMVWQGAHLLPGRNHLKVVFSQAGS